MSDKVELTKVDQSKLLDVARAAGLTVKQQTAYTKCTFDGSPAKLYVANTKRVTRVDLSGFTLVDDGVVQISREQAHELKLGNVQAQIDFTQSEDVILNSMAKVCDALKSVPQSEQKEKAPRKPRVKKTTVEVEAVTSDPAGEEEVQAAPSEEDLEKAARREAIKASAKRMAEEVTNTSVNE